MRGAGREPSEDDCTRTAYAPLDTLKRIAENVWVVDGAPIATLGLVLPVRMTVVRLESGDILLHSPTQYSRSLAIAIADLGPVRHLVAPSTGHWQFLGGWQNAAPQATTWAVPGLRSRSQVRKSGIRIDHDLTANPPEPWAEEIAQGIIEGAGGFREAWFFHRRSRTLLLTDLIDNMEPAKLNPLTSLVMRAAGATRGTTPRHVRAALLLNRRGNREAFRHLIRLGAERVVFAHGRWFESNGQGQLRQALSWLARTA